MLTKKILISIGITIAILGCNSPSKSSHLKEYTIKTSINNCNGKTNEKRSAYTNSIITNDHTYIAYLYEKDKKMLTLTHYNVPFNCDKRGIEAHFFLINNNTIKIAEKQNLPKGAGVYCMCLYDITVQIEDIIEAKKYTIIYDDGYSDDIRFDIDLTKETRGEKSFVRTKYPYNTRSTK